MSVVITPSNEEAPYVQRDVFSIFSLAVHLTAAIRTLQCSSSLHFPFNTDSIPVSFGSFEETSAVDHIHFSNVQCTGAEAQLSACQHSSNTGTCSHSEDAGVVCKGNNSAR